MGDHETVIWVTHDTILAAFVARILTIDFNLDDWPDYLGFLLAVFFKVVVASNNQKGVVTYLLAV